MTRNFGRATLFVIGATVLFLTGGAKADAQPGINVTVYNNYWYNASPPLPGDDRIVGTLLESNIDHNFDQFPLFNLYEDFAVKYEGFITALCTCEIQFMAQADDGTKLYLDDVLITNDWRDKGGGGSVSEPVQFEEGVSKQITLWFYENGGGAWVKLYWMVNDQWEIVPASAFTTHELLPTTTLPPTTTTEPPQTTTSTSSTTTTTEVPTTEAPTTTTTTILETTTTTQPATTTTVQQAPTTTTTSSTTSTTTTIPIETTTTSPSTTTTTIAPQLEELKTLVEDGLNDEQATELATNPDVLEVATADVAEEIFAAINEEALTPEAGLAIVEAVQDAPQEVREAFEKEIDIFAGNTDTYVPVGSAIPVSQRRAIIAISAMTSLAPVASRRRW